MRNPDRIELFLKEVQKLWEKYPDLRFMQLICNLQGEFGNDGFYWEDNDTLEKLMQHLKIDLYETNNIDEVYSGTNVAETTNKVSNATMSDDEILNALDCFSVQAQKDNSVEFARVTQAASERLRQLIALQQKSNHALDTNKKLTEKIAKMQREHDTTTKILNKMLIDLFPFLQPRNVWTDEIPEGYDYSYTLLDDIEDGWRIAFGEELCEELREALIKDHCLDKFRFSQIKEKYGRLCLYNFGATEAVHKVLSKYENLSARICIKCGKPATKRSLGWVSPWCDDCAEELLKNGHEKCVPIGSEEDVWA